MGGVATSLLYSSIAFTVCVCVCGGGGGGGGELEESLLYYILILQSSELTMQDSHASFYSTKTLYHLYISDSF